MATMRIGLNVSPFSARPKNETFSGTISLPKTIQGAVRINSATLRMKWVRVYTQYCYLDFACGTSNGSTPVLEGSDGSAVIREVPLTVNNVGNLFELNGREITFTIRSSNPSWTGNFFGIYSIIDFWIDVDYTVLQSDLTLNKSSMYAGDTVRASITSYDSAYRHEILWSCGTYSKRDLLAAGIGSKDFTFPFEWLPSTSSGTLTAKLETYHNSTLIGSATKTIPITVSSGVLPTITALNVSRVNNGVPSAWGVYVEKYSKATLTISGAMPSEGSTIESYRIAGPELSVNTVSGTTSVLPKGTHTYTCEITDRRGRKATAQVSIIVEAYAKPTITQSTVFRCSDMGEQLGNGTYIKAGLNYKIASVVSKNTAKISISYRKRGTTDWTTPHDEIALASGGFKIIGDGGIDLLSSYEVMFAVKDGMGNTAEYTDLVGTSAVFMHKRAGGLGLGLGSYCEEDKRLQLANDWEIVGGNYTGGDILNKLKTVDGAGSGLDADLFKGLDTNMFGLIAANSQTGITNKSFNFSPTGYGAGAYLLAVYSAWSTSSGNFGLYYIAASGSTYGAVLPIIAGSNITTTFTASTQTLEIVCVNAARMSLTRIGNTLTYD